MKKVSVNRKMNVLEKVRTINDEYNYFITINDSLELEKKKSGRLADIYVSVKDCVCVKGMETRASSSILTGYKPLFDATVVTRIKEEGGKIIGKTIQDIFGFGSFAINVGKNKVPVNPHDNTRVTGGSSGGSAGITATADFPHIAIAESTGGSIALPASYCGVYGLTPTYGLVSRYGLLDYANSLDKIGVMATNIDDISLMLEIIAGHDKLDSTSVKKEQEKYTEKKHDKFKIGVIKEGFSVPKNIQEGIMKRLGDYENVSLPLVFEYGVQTYYIISLSEASTNLAKFCGMKYGAAEALEGEYNAYFSNVRSKHFEREAKRRIILGTFARMSGFREAYYIKALKVRTKMIELYKALFEKYDILISPASPNIAPTFDEVGKLSPLETYMTDVLTVGPNLCGFPHISIPSEEKGEMPFGMLAIADHFQEQKLIDFARNLE